MGLLWLADSFLSFLVLVESSYAVLHTSWNKTARTIFRVEKASTQFRGSLRVNDHTPEIF